MSRENTAPASTRALPTRDDLLDLLPPLVGGLLIVLSVVHVLTEDETLWIDVLEVTFPLLAGGAFILLTSWFRDLEFSTGLKFQIVQSSLVAATAVVAVLLWEHVLLSTEGIQIPASEQQQILFNGVAIGSLLGGGIGYFRAESQQLLEQRLRATQDYETIFDNVEEALFVHDAGTTQIRDVNQKAAAMLGYSKAELVGKHILDVTADREALDEGFARKKARQAHEEPQRFEWVFERKDGDEIWIETTLKYATIGGQDSLLAVVRDITDRKEYETRLERQNEEMEVFNSLLRHDVLNGMTVIRTRADVLARDLDGAHKQYAETIVEWSDNITGLVQRIRDVINTLTGEELALERMNLSRALREQVDTVARSYPEVAFETEVPDDVFVEANELLPDVFKNLLTNAVEHNERDGLRIEATVTVHEETARVRIADNGRGIPDEFKDEIFRRGRTGHVKRTGSGFGLFFVDAMVTAYGGDIHIEDNEMGGATFVIDLALDRPAEQE